MKEPRVCARLLLFGLAERICGRAPASTYVGMDTHGESSIEAATLDCAGAVP